MNIKDLIVRQTQHNLWANKRIVEWLRGKPAADMLREMSSGFGGILPTLVHLAQVQEFWCSVLCGSKIRSGAASDKFEPVCQNYLKVSATLAELAAGLTEESFVEQIIFYAPNVGEVRQKRVDLFVQCLTHNIHHRGQILVVGRALGYSDAPMTDYIFYVHSENFAG